MANAEIKLNEFCERVRQNLEQCTHQEKRLALDALDIKVVATQQGIDIKGSIPIKIATTDLNLLTIGRTSGCMLIHNKNNAKESRLKLLTIERS